MSGDNTPLGPVAEWAEAERLAREQVGWLLQYQLGGLIIPRETVVRSGVA